MAQGYPPPQYGRNPYAQPQPQPQPQQPYPPQPYPPAPSYQQSYPPQGYAPPQGHPRSLPPCPGEAGGGRRFLAVVLDWLFAIGLGFVAADAASRPRTGQVAGHAAQGGGPAVPYFVALLVVGLGASFLNQVVLARLTGFSVGKGIMAMRVVRRKGVTRPNTWRLTRRWLLGFVVLAVNLLTEDYDTDEGDVVGMRSVRWKHLQEYQQAVARLG